MSTVDSLVVGLSNAIDAFVTSFLELESSYTLGFLHRRITKIELFINELDRSVRHGEFPDEKKVLELSDAIVTGFTPAVVKFVNQERTEEQQETVDAALVQYCEIVRRVDDLLAILKRLAVKSDDSKN
jgi:hypothetical protein